MLLNSNQKYVDAIHFGHAVFSVILTLSLANVEIFSGFALHLHFSTIIFIFSFFDRCILKFNKTKCFFSGKMRSTLDFPLIWLQSLLQLAFEFSRPLKRNSMSSTRKKAGIKRSVFGKSHQKFEFTIKKCAKSVRRNINVRLAVEQRNEYEYGIIH